LSTARTINESLREYARGGVGGLLFSLPLLYTMEVWDAGVIFDAPRLIIYSGVTFVLLLGYNRYAGLRHDASYTEVAIDSVEEIGLGYWSRRSPSGYSGALPQRCRLTKSSVGL
jgi:uncharacterized membrane protein